MSTEDKKFTKLIENDSCPRSFVLRRGKLMVLSGPDKGRAFIVDRPEITIGSMPDNTVVLSDPTISRNHAALIESSGGYLIKDLSSTNGTFLNGVRIRETYIGFGSVITLGHTQVSFVPCDESVEVYPSANNTFGDVYGQSVKMRTIFAILERVSPSDATIVLEGESGTGKELIARAIHGKSARADKPFVIFDCGSVAQNLIESELFGHEKGAFTGATSSREGVFEQAHGGTVFFDEIGELGIDLQPKLLRALENRQVKRVGGNRTIGVNVRVLAATNRDLSKEVAAGRFREDLFYRISVLRLSLPPLRDRREDVGLITNQLVCKLAGEYGIAAVPKVDPATLEILLSHRWPGNVRELRNVLNRALAMGDRTVIRPEDLMLLSAAESDSKTGDSLSGMSLEEIEKISIRKALQRNQGNKTRAAKDLGIAYSTLFEKMKKYGLQ